MASLFKTPNTASWPPPRSISDLHAFARDGVSAWRQGGGGIAVKGFAYRDLMSRYVVEHASGFTRMLWRVRACLIDAETGETLEARTQKVADDLRRVLERVDAGELEPLPADASPFRRYEASAGLDGWHYLLRAEGALDHESFARTRSETLAKRAVEALNRDNPRRLRDPHGPTKAGWF